MEEVLRAIAARASSLLERATPAFVAASDADADELIAQREQAWLDAAAKGDREGFRMRLSWDGLDDAGARRAVGPAALARDAELPAWASVLGEILRAAGTVVRSDRCLDAHQPIAFEEILMPFVHWARARCQERAGAAYQGFAPAAHASLERQLLGWLSVRAARALAIELSLALTEQGSALDALLEPQPSRRVYDALVARLLSGGLLGFFEEYSVLARVLVQTSELWVDATGELLCRFRADAADLGSRLGIAGDLQVTSVRPSLSDPHGGLRSVSVLRFASGRGVVYKPRDSAIELAWNELLAWLRAAGAPADLHSARVLLRPGYGWAELIEHAACRDQREARLYFRNAGALLCVIYLLRGTDCHADNVIAAGDHPVLIDLETLLSPPVRGAGHLTDAARLAEARLLGSVLASYFLPVWSRWSVPGQLFDGSALGADAEQERVLSSRRWACVNTDLMRLTSGPREKTTPPRAAMTDGRPLRVYEHEAALVEGFQTFYRFLMQQRGALLAADGPLQRLAAVQVRFVYRHTTVYVTLLELLRDPRCLRDGVERGLQIEQLAQAAVLGQRSDGRLGWAEIWASEREAIERGDVPYFSAVAGGDALFAPTARVIPGWFDPSAHAAVLERLRSLDELDLALQTDFIRSSLRSRAPAAQAEPTPVAGVAPRPGSPAALGPAPEQDADRALAIARAIVGGAIHGEDGSLSWLQPALSQQALLDDPRRDLAVVGGDLYDGALGIGLFLASVERLLPGSGMQRFALGTIRSLLAELEHAPEQTADFMGIGGFSGLGSLVYGLTSIGALLGRAELLEAAAAACALITPARIDADDGLDVTWGSAGALLGALRLHEVCGSSPALATALRCGERLAAALEPAGPGQLALRTRDGKRLSGFSHGAAGVAYALSRLHAASGDSRLLDAARALVRFERAQFLPDPGDWPDLRYDGPPRFPAAWCHGGPGIALARVASLSALDDPETRAEIEAGLQVAARPSSAALQQLCCGDMGRIEILATAARRLRRPDLLERARVLARESLAQAQRRGGFTLGQAAAGQLRCQSLFQGLAGVGHVLLRLAAPEQPLPEPLLLQ